MYKCIRRFKGIALNGKEINIPYGSSLEVNNGMILYSNNNALTGVCLEGSEIALQYFIVESEDWQSCGALYLNILQKTSGESSLNEKDKTVKDKCFDVLESDITANLYIKDPDGFVWNRVKLNSAPYDDLKHIWKMIQNI